MDENIWVAGTDGENSNIGSKSTGWVFVVASDLAMVYEDGKTEKTDGVHTTGFYSPAPSGNGVIGLHAEGGHVEDNYINQLRYWKRIANNYSLAERTTQLYDGDNPRTFSDGTPITAANEPLQSFISLAGTDQYGKDGNQDGYVAIGWIYAAASSAVPGRYLTVSTQSATDENAITGFGNRTGTTVNVKHATVNTYYDENNSAVTNGSYDLTYIAINANNRDASDASNIKFTNTIGNIAVYYRDAGDDVIDLGANTNNGKSHLQKEDGKALMYTKLSNAKLDGMTQFDPKDDYSGPKTTGIAVGTIGYYPRLVRITGSDGDGIARQTDETFTKTGLYEGYLDIYLIDENNALKVIGSVPFVYQITPKEVSLKYEKGSDEEDGKFDRGYYDGDAKWASFCFSVDGKEWSDYLTTDIGSTTGFTTYLAQFGLIYMFKSGLSDASEYMDITSRVESVYGQSVAIPIEMKGESASITITASHQYMNVHINDMKNVGTYKFVSSATNRYQKYTYNKDEGGWTTSEDKIYALTADGAFYFVGNKDMEETTGVIHNNVDNYIEYPYYEIMSNELIVSWAKDPSENNSSIIRYDGQEHKFLSLQFEPEKAFKTADDLKNELLSAVNFNIAVSGKATKTVPLDEAHIESCTNALIVFKVELGPHAGRYNLSFDPGDSNWHTQYCTVTPKGSTSEGTGSSQSLSSKARYIYQAILSVKYTDAKGNWNETGAKTYEYNAQNQGVMSATINGTIYGNDKPFTDSSAALTKGTSTVASAYKFTSGSSNVFTPNAGKIVDAGRYTFTITLPANSDYTLTENDKEFSAVSTSTRSWTIDPYALSVTAKTVGGDVYYDGTAHLLDVEIKHGTTTLGSNVVKRNANGTYTITPFPSENDKITIKPSGEQYAVNAQTYTLTIDGSATEFTDTVEGNYTITTSGGGSLTIKPVPVALAWDNTANAFVYDGKEHGLSLARPTIQGFTINTVSAPTREGTGCYVTITVTNANGGTETLKVLLEGTPLAKDVSDDPYTVTCAQNVDVRGDNAAGTGASIQGNYAFTFPQEGSYTITPATLTDFEITGGETSKVYDHTRDVLNLGAVKFNGLVSGESLTKDADYTVTATYESANVGTWKITYTVTLLNGDVVKNYTLSKNTFEISNGRITARPLTVTLRLKNGEATKVYDGNKSYGGDGATGQSSPSATSRSQRYIAGNGFTVTNFVESGIQVTAEFRETGSGRSDYDDFVNHLNDPDKKSFKQLVFKVNSANYTIVVEGGNAVTESSGGSVAYVVNSNDNTAASAKAEYNISITPKPITATYSNTAQSYVQPDNTYTKADQWLEVTGSVGSGTQTDDLVKIDVTNGWFDRSGGDEQYTAYTVIRGSERSSKLKAELVTTATDDTKAAYYAYMNYTLKNQPVLVIGYFIGGDEFEIFSLSSLLIASYYYSISGSTEDNPFSDAIPNMQLQTFCTNDQYEEDPEGWQKKMDESEYDIYYDSTTDNWVYYEEVEGEAPKYTSFKLIKDISGVFTQMDINVLTGMFTKTTFDETGAESTIDYTWGYGQSGDKVVLKNVLRAKVGDTLTIVDSLFGNFTGTFDGNGYVINGINIMGGVPMQGVDTANAGLFATIAEGAKVSNLHLRNVNVVASGVENVGALAGTASADITNVSVQGIYNITGGTNVGGVVGNLTANLSQVIAMGTINTNGTTYVGGVAGASTGTITSAVSMMYIWATGATYVGGIVGSGTASGTYMKDSLWKDGANVGADGVSYSDLYAGSKSGYTAGNEYYLSTSIESKGAYDVLDESEYTLNDHAVEETDNPRQSMRLCDIIDVYLLQYTISATGTYAKGETTLSVYKKSATSWLVGDAKGTNDSPIIIANQQGVSLLRELRFATFELAADVYMYSTYKLTTYQGAFFGAVTANGYHIYIKGYDGTTKMFANTTAIPLAKY